MALLRWLQRNVVAGETDFAHGLAVAAACAGAATAFRWALDSVLGDLLPFATFYPAVLFAALIGGWRVGAATLLLSLAAGWFLFMAPAGRAPAATAAVAAMVTFLLTAGLVLATAALLRQALSELVAARELGERLNRELQHRVKNTLAIVQSLAWQTARRSAGDLKAFEGAFQGRLQALGVAQDVLIAGTLTDCRLPRLAEDALRPFSEAYQDRIAIRGGPAILPPDACVPLVLALHELATNAVKYGALSSDDGRVELQWQGDRSAGAEAVRLRWRERDGPAVQAPARQGLGSRLLRPAPAQHLDEVNVDFAPAGLVCEILVRTDGHTTPKSQARTPNV